MGGKYEIRYYQEDGEYTTHYTNSWFTYMILRFTKKTYLLQSLLQLKYVFYLERRQNMTTVYVVTSGSYSDYGIDKIFLDEEKANQYLELCKNSDNCDVNDLEIYETSDDEIYKADIIFRVDYNIKRNEKTEYTFRIFQTPKEINDNEPNIMNNYKSTQIIVKIGNLLLFINPYQT